MSMLTNKYFDEYKRRQSLTISKHFSKVKKTDFTKEMLGESFRESAIASSNIEGNPLDYNTYLRYKKFNGKRTPRSVQEIDDLIQAYEFARKNELTKNNVLETHLMLSKAFQIV